jgi:uncharacterized protein YbaP (TraB family)
MLIFIDSVRAAVFESAVPTVRRFLLVLALTIFVGACHRAEIGPSFVDAASAAKGSVWVVDAPGSAGRLFFCGTIHILREEDYPLSPAYEGAYANSDKLVLELPPNSSAGQRMGELGTYPDDTSLEAHVSKDIWAGVKKWASQRKLNLAMLNRFRPWYLSLVITSTEYTALGAKSDIGVDQYFEARAKKDGKPGEGLETVEFQLQLFAKLTDAQQQNLLEQTLAEIHTLPQEYDKMITAWKNGSLDELHDMLFDEAERYPELMELFLTSRNRAWIDPLDKMLKKGDKAMILVGAGHLAGKTGVLQLLKDRGYRVRHYREVKDL